MKQELKGLTLTAPISGFVHGLSISGAQAVVQPAKPILHLVPNDQPYVITAKIAPEEITHLFVGQASTIKLLLKGAGQELQGRLHRLSADTFQGRPDSPPYYVFEIALNSPKNATPNGKAPLLRPGMPAQVLSAKTTAALWTIYLNQSAAISLKHCGNINFRFSHRMFPPIAVGK